MNEILNELPDPKEIGKRLRKLRGKRSRTRVSKDLLGVSISRLCNYELGLRCVPDDIKVTLCNYYGVSVQSIFYTL